MSEVESYTGLTLSLRIYDALSLKRIVDREVSTGALYDKQFASEVSKSPLIVTQFKDLFNNSITNSLLKSCAVNTKVKVIFAVVSSAPYKYTNRGGGNYKGSGSSGVGNDTPRREMTSCSLSDLKTSVTANATNGDNYQNPIRLHILDPDYKFVNTSNNNSSSSSSGSSSAKNFLREGMLVMLINPHVIYKPGATLTASAGDDGTARNTRNITVEIFNASQVIHVGVARHYGTCSGVLAARPEASKQPLFKVSDKNSSFDQLIHEKEQSARTHCSMPVNTSLTRYCCYHSQQANKEVNRDKEPSTAGGQSRFNIVFGENTAPLHPSRTGVGASRGGSSGNLAEQTDFLGDIFGGPSISDSGDRKRKAVDGGIVGSGGNKKPVREGGLTGSGRKCLPDEVSESVPGTDSVLFEEELDDRRREATIRGVTEDPTAFSMNSRTTAEEVGAWVTGAEATGSAVRPPKESSVFSYGAKVHREKQEQLVRQKQSVANSGGLPFSQLLVQSSVVPGVAGVGLGVRVGGLAVDARGARISTDQPRQPGSSAGTGVGVRRSAADRLLNTKSNVRMQEYAALLADLKGGSSVAAAGTSRSGVDSGSLVAVGGAGMLVDQNALLRNSRAHSVSQPTAPVPALTAPAAVGAKARTTDTLRSMLQQDRKQVAGSNTAATSSFAALQSRHNLHLQSKQDTLVHKVNGKLADQKQAAEQHRLEMRRAHATEQVRLEVLRRQELAAQQVQEKARVQALARTKAAKDDEINKLLARSSSHADAEAAEWFDGFGKRLKKLEAREYMVEKENTATRDGITISAQFCKECNVVHESRGGDGKNGDQASQLRIRNCASKGHRCSTITVVKKFFECSGCLRKTSTLTPVVSGSNSSSSGTSTNSSSSSNSSSGHGGASKMLIRPPQFNCSYCQKQDWKSCGIKGSYYSGGIRGDTSKSIISEKNKYQNQPTGNGISGTTSINYFDT